MDLVCPKCHGAMRTYERSGVTVDQCAECRGVFLDRGELERLVDAETSWHAQRAPAQPAPQYRDSQERDSRDSRDSYGHQSYGHESYGQGHGSKKRRKSFMEELFD